MNEIFYLDEIIYLDLQKNKLYGWEPSVSDKVIESIIKGIEIDSDFPAVPVHKISDSEYELSLSSTVINPYDFGEITDGGHNRAIAHYIVSKSLKCVLKFGRSPTPKGGYFWIPIQDIIIEDDDGEYSDRKDAFKNYI